MNLDMRRSWISLLWGHKPLLAWSVHSAPHVISSLLQ